MVNRWSLWWLGGLEGRRSLLASVQQNNAAKKTVDFIFDLTKAEYHERVVDAG
jgi:hypothetical protein